MFRVVVPSEKPVNWPVNSTGKLVPCPPAEGLIVSVGVAGVTVNPPGTSRLSPPVAIEKE